MLSNTNTNTNTNTNIFQGHEYSRPSLATHKRQRSTRKLERRAAAGVPTATSITLSSTLPLPLSSSPSIFARLLTPSCFVYLLVLLFLHLRQLHPRHHLQSPPFASAFTTTLTQTMPMRSPATTTSSANTHRLLPILTPNILSRHECPRHSNDLATTYATILYSRLRIRSSHQCDVHIETQTQTRSAWGCDEQPINTSTDAISAPPSNYQHLNHQHHHHLSHSPCTAFIEKISTLTISTGSGRTGTGTGTDSSRRFAVQSLLTASAIATSAVMLPALPARAGKPEFNPATGELFTPKNEMLSGGSAAARGITVKVQPNEIKPGQAVQTVYEPRFVAYLSRFLLNFDPAANAYWVRNNGLGDTWDSFLMVSTDNGDDKRRQELAASFAEFAESVEIGLADYFVGPYGSYSSLSAMKAGLTAVAPARSTRPVDDPNDAKNVLQRILLRQRRKMEAPADLARVEQNRNRIAKQGVLNLYTLLKARYTTAPAKRQLAILFSFLFNPELQPTAEISSLLGELDDASIIKVDLIRPISRQESTSRTSSRRGGGYGAIPPKVTVTPPPALGDNYRPARARAIMQPTSRILRIVVTDGGKGYVMPPEVTIASGGSRLASACVILDREGHVESVLVLDPGYGYGKRNGDPPRVSIAAPAPTKDVDPDSLRRAKAVAELEYQVVDIDLVEGGNGFVLSEPPRVTIEPPQCDPDWYLDTTELTALHAEYGMFRVQVSQMRDGSGKLIEMEQFKKASSSIELLPLDVYQNNPLELLPSSVRPRLISVGGKKNINEKVYTIAELAPIPTYSNIPSPRYRAIDPVFGAIGTVPVTKSALELSPGEYARLALSGALCTVIVRTLLNPLELVKTKQQLKNDVELFQYTSKYGQAELDHPITNGTDVEHAGKAQPTSKDGKVGSLTLAQNLVQLRGTSALFQSADITFLASLVFGSFGFGATELFRRSFTMAFSSDGSDLRPEVILLVAAALATILTSAAATPFEVLRVRSMGLVEPKPWTAVLADFLAEEKKSSSKTRPKFWPRWQLAPSHAKDEAQPFSFGTLNPMDLLPLWAGFAPTASRELAFAIPKFLVFDVLSASITSFVNSQADPGALPVVPGVGTEGLIISAFSGALAGIAGAIVSHPFDLILTFTSSSSSSSSSSKKSKDWREVVKELLSRDGGIANLFLGLLPRLTFFFLVIGLQFFLYDYVKNLLQVGSDDLSLVLDVFYAVRQGLIDSM